ncbi:MAG: T9SS type A sorting domain-containing protein [Bacteroidia bacterium]|nr:T9SS type A sorting domain-containing protein [Bacteroidia bacterium]
MKKSNITILIITLQSLVLFAQQFDCSGGRYLDSLFGVTVTSNVLYGHNFNYNGTARDLMMDIYTPTGDTLAERPLIIFAPKGSFIQENKAELTMVQLCTHFASLGYVAAAIDYRVGVNYTLVMQNAPREFTYAVLRAYHDYKAAIRYFRKDAATANTYKIDPDMIIAGGSSAGAITALHVAYLDKVSEVPTYIDTTGLGGMEGNSGNPGYSTEVNYVVNLCGAIADTTWIEPGNIPAVSMHGNLDTEVPYGTATITMIVPIMEVDGSASVNLRMQHIGIENPFYTFWGKQHIPYDQNAGGSYLLYMDTVLGYVTTHLHDWICETTSVRNNQSNQKIVVSPNPASNEIKISFGMNNYPKNISVEIFDYCGKLVYSQRMKTDIDDRINLTGIGKGFYLLKIKGDNFIRTEKIIIQ